MLSNLLCRIVWPRSTILIPWSYLSYLLYVNLYLQSHAMSSLGADEICNSSMTHFEIDNVPEEDSGLLKYCGRMYDDVDVVDGLTSG